MNEQELIASAYEDAIKKLYAVLFDSFVQASGGADEEQQAEENFRIGVAKARHARERALQLLG